jgi:putative endonuclease
MPKPWFVYILRCADGSYYTGITTDPPRRLAQHNAGRGCAFTARRLPVQLAYCEPHPDRSSARRREIQLKPLSRANKEQLIRSQQDGFPSHVPRA